jgi:hypothetical protein
VSALAGRASVVRGPSTYETERKLVFLMDYMYACWAEFRVCHTIPVQPTRSASAR